MEILQIPVILKVKPGEKVIHNGETVTIKDITLIKVFYTVVKEDGTEEIVDGHQIKKAE